MELDLTQAVITLLSTTTLGGIYAAVRYRKENKKLKENEVKKDNVETQRQEMNLADDYMKKVMELSEMNYQQSLKNGKDNEDIIKKVDSIAEEQRSIVSYLNGDYQNFLNKKYKKTTKQTTKKK